MATRAASVTGQSATLEEGQSEDTQRRPNFRTQYARTPPSFWPASPAGYCSPQGSYLETATHHRIRFDQPPPLQWGEVTGPSGCVSVPAMETTTEYRPWPSENIRRAVPTTFGVHNDAAYTGARLPNFTGARLGGAPSAQHERKSPVFAFSTGARTLAQSAILCCFWDLESTGLSVKSDHIIQIGCTCRVFHIPSPGGQGYFSMIEGLSEEDHDLSIYVKTDKPIPQEITELTSIDENLLRHQGVDLVEALRRWGDWLRDIRWRLRLDLEQQCELWLIAHNGNQFDLPLLFHQELSRLRWSPGTFLKEIDVAAIVDSVVLSRALYFAEQEGERHLEGLADTSGSAQMAAHAVARSHRLSDLYWDSFHQTMENQHNALYDAKAVFLVMSQEPFLSAWSRDLVAWRLPDYIQAFHRAFEKHREDPLGKRMAELQINRCLSDSVHNGTHRSRINSMMCGGLSETMPACLSPPLMTVHQSSVSMDCFKTPGSAKAYAPALASGAVPRKKAVRSAVKTTAPAAVVETCAPVAPVSEAQVLGRQASELWKGFREKAASRSKNQSSTDPSNNASSMKRNNRFDKSTPPDTT